MYHHKKMAFGGLALTAEDHRKEAELLLRGLLAYLDGFENSTGAARAGYATTALMTYGSLLQAERDADVPNMSISREASKRVVKVIEFLSRAR
jgi:hypothetical protein